MREPEEMNSSVRAQNFPGFYIKNTHFKSTNLCDLHLYGSTARLNFVLQTPNNILLTKATLESEKKQVNKNRENPKTISQISDSIMQRYPLQNI